MQTPYHYVNLFQSAGILFTDDYIKDKNKTRIRSNKDLSQTSDEFKAQSLLSESIRKSIDTYITYAALEYDLLQYPDKVIAMA